MKKILIISTICIILFSACKKEVKHSEFTLGISAYSYKLDTIDTKVFIDGQEYYNSDIIYEGFVPIVSEIKVTLEQGIHKIRMENLDKSSVFEQKFNLNKEKIWGALEFNRKDTSLNEKHVYLFYTSPNIIGYD